MKRSQTHQYQIEVDYAESAFGAGARQVRFGQPVSGKISKAIRGVGYMFMGVWRYFIALGYQKHRVQTTWFTKRNVFLLKLGSAAAIALFVFRSDFQVSINLGEQKNTPASKTSPNEGKIGMATAMSLSPVMEKARALPVSDYKSSSYEDLNHRQIDRYIKHHSDLAKQEMRYFGIPASLKMAIAILESKAGTGEATQQFNNHFGKHLKGVNFSSNETNWRAHSLYLTENYPDLKELNGNYLDWIKSLEALGFGARPNYLNEVLQIIKDYQLYRLDR